MKFRARLWKNYATWFVIAQIGLILLIIYRENRFIAQLYELQKCEQQYQTVLTTHKQLSHKLHETKSAEGAKSYAAQRPQLKPIPLSAVHDIHDQQSS